MKKIIALILMMMVCLPALASGVPFAETGLDKTILTERYGAVVEENGDFSASSIKARAIENLFNGKIMTYAAGGMLMFNVQVEGNFETGISYPVLRVVYAGSSQLNANTVMFNVGGTVYAARVSSTVTNYGRNRIETMKAYLTEDGFELVNALKKAPKAEITILGNDQYTQTAEKAAFYASQKLEISAECLSAMELPLGTPDFASYELRTLSEKAFDAKYGAGTKVEKVKKVECDLTLDKTFGLAADNAPTATIKAVQDLLKKNGFFVGTTGMQLTGEMIAAVKAAQGYYGFDVTGYADAKLINALSQNAKMAEIKPDDRSISYAHASSLISFNVNNWWLADRVETTVPGGGVSAADQDNVLLIFDGEIASHALKSLSLSWEIKAEAVMDGKYVFPCAIYTETQQGAVLSTTLGMLREGRLVIVSEIPGSVSEMEGEWTLNVSVGGEEFALQLTK